MKNVFKFEEYLTEKKKAKKDKEETKKCSKCENDPCECKKGKEEKEEPKTGLTAKQKKLPEGLQKAILARQNKKK